MTFLPVVERELRTAARQRISHRTRIIAAGIALAIWFLLSVFGHNMTSPQRAEAIFRTITTLSIGFAMLAGAFLTADCLSEERREGTLGLLFLTDLKGHDVVLGKLASTSLHSIYGLLAVVPMLAVPLLMGGVTLGEFARTALVLLATLLLSLSVGMFVSAISHDSRTAFLRTLGIMIILSGVMPLLWWGFRILFRISTFNFLLLPSPGYALRYAADSFYSTRSGAGEFWICMLVIGGLAAVSLLAASLLLPRVWQQTSSENHERPPSPANLKRRDSLRALLEARPYFWLATRDGRMGRWASWIIGIPLLFWFAFYLHSGFGRPGSASFVITIFVAFALHVLFKCMVIAEATRRLSEDRQSGALELLLVTPLRPTEIIAGQKAALAQMFRRPKWMLIGMNLLLILFLIDGALGPGSDRHIFTIIFVGGIVLLVSDCFVIGPASVWAALTTKRHTRAILKTARSILLSSWVGILFFWFIGVTSGGINSNTVATMVVIWIVLGLAVDAITLAMTTRRLNLGFRELAAAGTAGSRKGYERPHMNVFPVIVRELRGQARQPFTFWLRMIGVMALLGGGAFFMLNFAFTPNRGGALFGYMHLLLLAAVWILVPLGAADCLSRERREGTLGLLFLTPLKPRDIVIAKGLTHGLRGLTLLVAVLPVLTIPFLIGGVSWQQATASAIINFSAICWALAAALIASAAARNSLRAMALAALLSAMALFAQSYIAGVLLGSGLGRNLRGGYSGFDFNLLMGFAANGLHPEAWNLWAGTAPRIRSRN